MAIKQRDWFSTSTPFPPSDPDPVTMISSRRLSETSQIGFDAAGTVWKSESVGPKVKEFKPVNVGQSHLVRRHSLTYLRKELEVDYHTVPIATLYNRFGTDPVRGLGESQRVKNVEVYGTNILTPPPKPSLLVKFAKTLIGGIQLLLWAGAILCFAAYLFQVVEGDAPFDNLYLGFILSGLVLILGLFTFYQEYSTDKIMESFTKMVPTYARVIKDEQIYSVNTNELVVGDIVDIKFGDRIPADIRIIECQDFKVDNSSLTGESNPQERTVESTNENPLETKNLAFFSSYALEGTARGLVVSTGNHAFIGRIAGLTSGVQTIDTPLSREVTHFVKLLCGFGSFFGAVFFIVAQTMGYSILDSILFVIGIIRHFRFL